MRNPRPPYAYIPGDHAFPHPHSLLGYRSAQKIFEAAGDEGVENAEDNFLHAIRLFKDGFFWESHVFFEAEWNALARRGVRAKLCSSLIILAAALLKVQSRKPETAVRMLASCSSKLAQVSEDLKNRNRDKS